MKRTAIMILLCAIMAGCVSVPDEPDTKPIGTTQTMTQPTTQPATAPTTVPATIPTETVFVPEIYPDVVGIYIPAGDGTAARKLITEFSGKRKAKTDIDCFEIIASREEVLGGRSFAAIWNSAWEQFENVQDAKIGFHIEFTLTSGETVSKQLLKPSDSTEFFAYLEIYMYDDIHQTPGVWYTHLEDDDVDDQTIISSIKLTSGSRIAEVGDITLTAFIYNGSDNFDKDGNYIGLISQAVIITE